jgi:hypothetical protein
MRGAQPQLFCRFFPLLAVLAGLLTFGSLAGCDSRVAQDTPDDTIATAFRLVKEGRAEKLPRLIYADSREFRSVLGRVERLAGAMQDLGQAVAKQFPNEVAGFAKQAEEQVKKAAAAAASPTAPAAPAAGAAKPNPAANLAAMFQRPGQGAKPATAAGAAAKPPEGEERRREFEQIVGRIFADPFSWISSVEGRLTTQLIADDQAAVLLDGQPVPPIGLTMRRADGKWYFELPLNLPVVSGYVPQTFSEWSIVGSLIRVFENTVRELADEVKAGKIARIEQLSEKAGEKAFVPAVMVFVAYGKEMDVRQRREKIVGELKKKLNEWSRERRDNGDDRDVLRIFTDATVRLAVEDLDLAVRRRVADKEAKLPEFAKMERADLSNYISSLYKPVGVTVDIAAAPSIDELKAAGQKAADYRRPKPKK